MLLNRPFVLSVLIFFAVFSVCLAQSGEERASGAAREIHQRILTLDTHVDIAGPEYATEKLDPGIDHPKLGGATDEQRKQYREGMKRVDERYPPAGLRDYVDHVDHAVEVAGIDHVGIGSDFDGGGGIPGFNDHSEALNVTAELLRRGYSEADIQKIWGGNLLRVWRKVEKVAAELRQSG